MVQHRLKEERSSYWEINTHSEIQMIQSSTRKLLPDHWGKTQLARTGLPIAKAKIGGGYILYSVTAKDNIFSSPILRVLVNVLFLVSIHSPENQKNTLPLEALLGLHFICYLYCFGSLYQCHVQLGPINLPTCSRHIRNWVVYFRKKQLIW